MFTREVQHYNYNAKVAQWTETAFSRGLLGFVGDNAPAVPQALRTKTPRMAAMGLVKDSKPLMGETDLLGVKVGTTDQTDPDGLRLDEAKDLTGMFDRTVEYCITKILRDGKLSNTDLPGSEVVFSIDYSIPTDNLPTVTTAWSDTSADIIGDIAAAIIAITKSGGIRPTRAVINSTVMSYLIKNTGIQALLNASNAITQVAAEGALKKFFGLEWILDDEMYVDDSDAVTNFITDDDCLLIPAAAVMGQKNIIEVMHGHNAVYDGAGQKLGVVVGRTVYTYTTPNPASEVIVMVDRFLPVLKQPSCVGCIDITP